MWPAAGPAEHVLCGRMVCTSCADSLDVCPLITLPSFICLLLFLSLRSLVAVLVFPVLGICQLVTRPPAMTDYRVETTTTTTIIIMYTPTL